MTECVSIPTQDRLLNKGCESKTSVPFPSRDPFEALIELRELCEFIMKLPHEVMYYYAESFSCLVPLSNFIAETFRLH
eukprot:jgi/Psemu1/300118/fgenesh1_kg.6_\